MIKQFGRLANDLSDLVREEIRDLLDEKEALQNRLADN